MIRNRHDMIGVCLTVNSKSVWILVIYDVGLTCQSYFVVSLVLSHTMTHHAAQQRAKASR